jgi:hypothetical protein
LPDLDRDEPLLLLLLAAEDDDALLDPLRTDEFVDRPDPAESEVELAVGLNSPAAFTSSPSGP